MDKRETDALGGLILWGSVLLGAWALTGEVHGATPGEGSARDSRPRLHCVEQSVVAGSPPVLVCEGVAGWELKGESAPRGRPYGLPGIVGKF